VKNISLFGVSIYETIFAKKSVVIIKYSGRDATCRINSAVFFFMRKKGRANFFIFSKLSIMDTIIIKTHFVIQASLHRLTHFVPAKYGFTPQLFALSLRQ
jgi:hypothetical protein